MQQAWHSRLSSMLEYDSPSGGGGGGGAALDNSEVTQETTFSALATGKKRSSESGRSLTLDKRSWAALTSGIADSGWRSR